MGGLREFVIRCVACSGPNPLGSYDCRVCGGTLLVDSEALTGPIARRSGTGIWRYSDLLPKTSAEVSLGEGDTPLVELTERLPQSQQKVWAKLESANPTLSFKDRGMALAVSAALDLGMSGLVVSSTGNSAVSASAYAAAAGLDCSVIVGAASKAARKLDACRAFGSAVREIEGDYSDAYAEAAALASTDIMNVSTTYRNPILAEGYRSVAWEIVDDLSGVPDAVVVPIGAGPFLRGIWLGFKDLCDSGRTSTLPRMFGVQAEACSPLTRAWRSPDWRKSLYEPLIAGPTSATAIADALRGYEDQGIVTLVAARESHGAIVAVGEREIERAEAQLRGLGIWVEPSSATALAALGEPELSALGRDATIVLLLTGHGIKSGSATPQQV